MKPNVVPAGAFSPNGASVSIPVMNQVRDTVEAAKADYDSQIARGRDEIDNLAETAGQSGDSLEAKLMDAATHYQPNEYALMGGPPGSNCNNFVAYLLAAINVAPPIIPDAPGLDNPTACERGSQEHVINNTWYKEDYIPPPEPVGG